MSSLHKFLLPATPTSLAHTYVAQEYTLQILSGAVLRPITQRRHICSPTGAVIQEGNITQPDGSTLSDLKQRTQEWFELRKDKLTASSFSSALGFWRDGRVELWKQKVGLRPVFGGNMATQWGIDHEAKAVQRYTELTGNAVKHLAFQVYKEEDFTQGWLGASPDGLIDTDALASYEKKGILEVKCPHNNGQPEFGIPGLCVPYYYMPQIQGLLEILDRDWLDLYIWTVNGSTVFRLNRDPEYWVLIFGVLSEFWWSHVIPAKQAILEGKDVNAFQPAAKHELTSRIKEKSKVLAQNAKVMFKELSIVENPE